ALRAQQASSITAMVSLAQSEPGIPATLDQFDTNPYLLNVENGTINLKTGRLEGHDPFNRLTKLAPVHYDETAACPQWLKFLDKVLKGDQELIHYVQKVVGYSLTGDTREQCFFILYGG